MILDGYVAVLGALAGGGVVLVVAGLAGTAGPAGPGPAALERLRRWWRGPGSAGHRPGTRQVLLIGAGLAAVTGYLVTGVPAIGLLAGAAVPGVPWLWQAGRREQRAIARVQALGDWTRRLKDQLSTGAGLVSAVVATAEAAPTAIAGEVHGVASRLRTGADPAAALRRFADELADPVADQVVAALLLHLADRGEHLGEVLAAIAADTGRQVSMRREVHARRTQPRVTVRFMTGFGLLTAGLLARGDLLSAYATARGQLVLLALAAGFVATLAWVRSLSQPPAQPRYLREIG
jgi:Flp pilus assembly protein TadB